jgi:isoaspartyl peptidase/L-asparaginase-like protein (Ntn-hydrolase superfamily)
MISPHARHQWEKWKSRLEDAAIGAADGKAIWDDLNDQQDTVGAIVITQDGDISAGVSRLDSSHMATCRY